MQPSTSEVPEDIHKENLRVRAASRIFPKPFSSFEKINSPEGMPPSEVNSPDLSKTTSVTNYIKSCHICGVRYTIKSFYISNRVHDPYFNVSSYRK